MSTLRMKYNDLNRKVLCISHPTEYKKILINKKGKHCKESVHDISFGTLVDVKIFVF